MPRNPGKIFEDDFKASVPKDVYFVRLHDSSIGFDIEHSTQRFALKSPYDAILCYQGQMYALELKSNQGTSLSFDGNTPKIKRKQIENLVAAKQKGGAIAGIVINFRTYEETYFIDAEVFYAFMNSVEKKSVNINDVRSMGIRIPEEKKISHSRYDISVILQLKEAKS